MAPLAFRSSASSAVSMATGGIKIKAIKIVTRYLLKHISISFKIVLKKFIKIDTACAIFLNLFVSNGHCHSCNRQFGSCFVL